MGDAWQAPRVRTVSNKLLAEGPRSRLLAGHGLQGLNAEELLEVEGAAPMAPESGNPGNPHPKEYLGAEVEIGPLVPARVKWFDKEKGFGFVNVFGRSEDIFVHMKTVRSSGFQDLASGEGIAVRMLRGPRGLMVTELSLWESSFNGNDQG